MPTSDWYTQLIKPMWSPPTWVFGPVWTVLYTIIALSFGILFHKAITRQIPRRVVLPFVLNLFFNGLFTPLQFGLKNNALASLDIVLVVSTLAWAFYMVWRMAPTLRWVVYVNIPYFLWGMFATCLQLTITFLHT